MIQLVKKSGRHKIRSHDPVSSYERELKAMEEFLPSFEEDRPAKKGKHKVKSEKVEPLLISPEELPEDESQEEWFERQKKQYESEAKEFQEMAETGKRFAIGTYTTVNKAVKSAKKFGRKANVFFQQIRGKFGKHEMKRTPVQVFIEPTEEGDYVVYGQVTKKEVPVVRPERPIKVSVPLKEEKYVKYGEY